MTIAIVKKTDEDIQLVFSSCGAILAKGLRNEHAAHLHAGVVVSHQSLKLLITNDVASVQRVLSVFSWSPDAPDHRCLGLFAATSAITRWT